MIKGLQIIQYISAYIRKADFLNSNKFRNITSNYLIQYYKGGVYKFIAIEAKLPYICFCR